MTLLKDCAVGDTVNVYVDSKGSTSKTPTTKSLEAIVLENPSKTWPNCVLVEWTGGIPYPFIHKRTHIGPDNEVVIVASIQSATPVQSPTVPMNTNPAMMLNQVPVGSWVEIYLDQNYHVSCVPTTRTHVFRVISQQGNHTEIHSSGYYMGLPDSDTIPVASWIPSSPPASVPTPNNGIHVEAAAKSSGMSCNRCNAFNEYAEPNQADGSHRCFSCRN